MEGVVEGDHLTKEPAASGVLGAEQKSWRVTHCGKGVLHKFSANPCTDLLPQAEPSSWPTAGELLIALQCHLVAFSLLEGATVHNRSLSSSTVCYDSPFRLSPSLSRASLGRGPCSVPLWVPRLSHWCCAARSFTVK